MINKMKKIVIVEDDWVDDDFYSEEARELLVEDDAISAEEDAFMRGYGEGR